ACAVDACDGIHATCPPTNVCTKDLDCAAGYYCSAGGTCVAQKTQGAICNAVAGADCKQTGCRVCGTGGGCVDGYCCNTTWANGCDYCNVAGALGTCTVAAAGNPGASPSCSPFLCGGSAACPASCTSDAMCATGFYCNSAGQCVAQKAQGTTCN